MQPHSLRPPSAEPAIVYSDADHAIGLFANLVISFSLAEPTRKYLEHWRAGYTSLVSAHRQIAVLNVIDSTAKPPSDAIRVEINQLIADSKNVIGSAMVVEGSGFIAAAKRSALSMVTLMSRSPYPIRIFGAVPEAANWLVGQTRTSGAPVKVEMRTLVAAAENVRKALKTAQPAQL